MTPTISFEFFPPKNDAAERQLWAAIPALAALNPKYMTVTYGAGGSTRDGTLSTLRLMRQKFPQIPLASHLTFLSTTKADLDPYIDLLWQMGVKHIVALRGDLPKGRSFDEFRGDEYYQYTSDFVAALLKKYPFEISVAAYPEKHPDAPTLAADIEALKKKCAAGAARAIAQFFFDNQVFYRFRDACAQAAITTLLCPGLLPIHDYASMCKFAARCGTSVPDFIHEKFADPDLHPEEAQKIAADLLILQVEDLAANGVEHIHFYTLNKAPVTLDACAVLGYRAAA